MLNYWKNFISFSDKSCFGSILESLRKMTPEEVFQKAVDSGIYHPNGELTDQYKEG